MNALLMVAFSNSFLSLQNGSFSKMVKRVNVTKHQGAMDIL